MALYEQAKRDATWFSVPANYLAATRRAVDERRLVFRDAAAALPWDGCRLHRRDDEIAASMRELASLAATENDNESARDLLRLSLRCAPAAAAAAAAAI